MCNQLQFELIQVYDFGLTDIIAPAVRNSAAAVERLLFTSVAFVRLSRFSVKDDKCLNALFICNAIYTFCIQEEVYTSRYLLELTECLIPGDESRTGLHN